MMVEKEKDIVSRLRKGRSANEWVSEELAREAADEIETLRSEAVTWKDIIEGLQREIERLRAALEKADEGLNFLHLYDLGGSKPGQERGESKTPDGKSFTGQGCEEW